MCGRIGRRFKQVFTILCRRALAGNRIYLLAITTDSVAQKTPAATNRGKCKAFASQRHSNIKIVFLPTPELDADQIIQIVLFIFHFILYLYSMAAKKDPRYKVVKIMIQANAIKTFKEIFTHLPKSIVAKDLRTNNNRMTNLIKDPAGFRVGEVETMAKMIGVDFMVLAGMIAKGR
jgi:hypothetical protein